MLKTETLQEQVKLNSQTRIKKKSHKSIMVSQRTKYSKLFGGGLASLFQKQHQKKQMIFKKQRVENLLDSLQPLDFNQRLDKAVRHFHDAYELREVRNDIECNIFVNKKVINNKFINLCYSIQSSTLFQYFLIFTAICYMFLTYFEPANRYDLQYEMYPQIMQIELVLLIIFTVELFLYATHTLHDSDRELSEKLYKNIKLLLEIILNLLFWIDYIYFWTNIDTDRLRIARYFRPVLLVVYSKELWRNFKSIYYSLPQILQMILFFILMNVFWAIIGWTVIGDLDGETHFDEYSQNFSNIFRATTIMYALSSPDSYPEMMLPAYNTSKFYAIYFLSYSILFQLLFIPVPVSITFEAFRRHRAKVAMQDRLMQHESLLSCFISLDYQDQKKLDFPLFETFMKRIYRNKKIYIQRIPRLFIQLDQTNAQHLSINDFFCIIEHMERDPRLSIPLFSDSKQWDIFRKFMNKLFKLKQFALSPWIEFLMFIVVVLNTVVIIIVLTSSEDTSIYQQIDDSLVYVYILEGVIKIIGLGVDKYFADDWNIFDFALIFISLVTLFTDSLLSVFKTIRTTQSRYSSNLYNSKVVKITRINRMFRSLKGVRSLKILNFLIVGADSLIEFKLLIQRLFLCIPLVIKLIPVIYSIFYFFALIGMDLYNINTFHYNEEESEFSVYTYADFTSFGDAILLLFQISLGPNWNVIVYDYCIKFHQYVEVIAFFYIFQILANLIILALIKGIVWEVFSIVQEFNTHREIPTEEEIENNSEKRDQYDNILKQIKIVKQTDSQKDFETQKLTFSEEAIAQPVRVFVRTAYSKHQNISIEYDEYITEMKELKEKKFQIMKNYFFLNFKTKKELRQVLALSSRESDDIALFDSDDETALQSYHKQILDGVHIQSQKNQLKRLQDSMSFLHYEKQKNEFYTQNDVNRNYIFHKAMLKDTNNDKIKKFETDYFQANYGKIYENIHKIDMEPIVKYEALILHNFDRILRHNSENFMPCINYLLCMEKNISDFLLCKGSIFKFIFQDNLDNWIYLDEVDGQVSACSADVGPWNFQDIFADNEIYTFLNFFNAHGDQDIQEEMLSYYYNVRQMVENYNQEFQNFQLQTAIIDCLMLVISNEQKKTHQDSLKYLNTQNLPIYIKKVNVMILMYSGEKKLEKERSLTRKGQHVKLKTIDTFKDQFKQEEDKISGFVSLPLNYVLEFMHDIKNILELQKNKLFIKMNQFLNRRVKQFS